MAENERSVTIEVTGIVRSAKRAEKGRRYFMADMQAHYPIPGELVEGGQLYLIESPRVGMTTGTITTITTTTDHDSEHAPAARPRIYAPALNLIRH